MTSMRPGLRALVLAVGILAGCSGSSGTTNNDAGHAATGCAAHTSCATCSDVAGCGWCGTNHSCMDGSANGSTDTTCTGTAWASNSGLCTTADPGYRCNAPGEHCGASLDCCGAGGFCSTSGTCDSTSCVAVGGQCGRDVECCSGHCQSDHTCAQ